MGRDSVRVDLLDWAERFIATSSVSHEGNHAIVRQAAQLLDEIGLAANIERVRQEGTEYSAIIADVAPPAAAALESGLLLVTHLDTVPPGDAAAWTATAGDPFQPTRAGEWLYGLGCADAKLDFICKAAALADTNAETLRCRIRLVGTFGEEIGLLGTRWLLASGLAQGFRYALVGEPSQLEAIQAHKGYAVFEARVSLEPATSQGWGEVEMRFRGRAAHSSTPALGENAIEHALCQLERPDVRAVVELRGGGAVNKVAEVACMRWLVEGKEGKGGETTRTAFATEPLRVFHHAWRQLREALARTRDENFDPDHSVGNLGRVSFDGNQAIFRFDLRPVPGVDPEQVVAPLRAVAEVECLRQNPALQTTDDSALLRALTQAQRSVGLDPRQGTKATCTEAGLLSAAGIETLVFGAGRSVGNVHRPNERTRINELELARAIYRATIKTLCIDPRKPCSC